MLFSFWSQLVLKIFVQCILRDWHCAHWRQILARLHEWSSVGSVAQSLDPICRVSSWSFLCDSRTLNLLEMLKTSFKEITSH
jgi:hypothetical protein